MTELLPIPLAGGNDESVDPRVSSPGTLAVATNVRWRKGGRPAKCYGRAAISTTGLDSAGNTAFASGYVSFATADAVGAPALCVGGGIRRLAGTTWASATEAASFHIPHFAPGRRTPIARNAQNPSVAYANGLVCTAYDDGTGAVYLNVSSVAGVSLLVNKQVASSGANQPRLVPVGNTVYIVYQSSTSVAAVAYDTTNPTAGFAAPVVVATLGASTNTFDTSPRNGTTWVLFYQTATGSLGVQLMTGTTVTTLRTFAITAASGNCLLSVSCTATSNIFLGYLETAFGSVRFRTYDSTLTTVGASNVLVNTNTKNVFPVTIISALTTGLGTIAWGGADATTGAGFGQNYLGSADITSAGGVSLRTTILGIAPASKLFFGPSSTDLSNDSAYLWVHTDNGPTGRTGANVWDDQKGLSLVQIKPNGGSATLQCAVPNVIATVDAYSTHLADVSQDANGEYQCSIGVASRVFGAGVAPIVLGVDRISVRDMFSNLAFAARDTAVAGRTLVVSGGSLQSYYNYSEDIGFLGAPVILSGTVTAGGALTASSSYQYVAVYEVIDAAGRLVQSTPSDPFQVTTTAGNQTANITVAALPVWRFASAPTVRLYRTLAGGAQYHLTAKASGGIGSGNIVFPDAVADTVIASAEFVYTDGGVVPNVMPPSSSFLAVSQTRVWLGGGLDRATLTASKFVIDGQPVQFSDETEFQVTLPEDCTGLASQDGIVIAFSSHAIYVIQGDGPDAQGVGEFQVPIRLPSDVGCIDWRSIVETSVGVFFQSKRGIYLLPRGGSPPEYIGAHVGDTATQFPMCLSATLVNIPSTMYSLGETTVRFAMGQTDVTQTGRVLTYDINAQCWSQDTFYITQGPPGPCGTWLDTFISTAATATQSFSALFAETPNAWNDGGGTGYNTVFATGDIRPFGVGGFGRFNRVIIVGEFRTACSVLVNVYVDGTLDGFRSYSLTAADATDGVVYLDATPKIAEGCSIKVQFSDAFTSPGEGFIMQAIMVEYDVIGKTKRLAVGRRT